MSGLNLFRQVYCPSHQVFGILIFTLKYFFKINHLSVAFLRFWSLFGPSKLGSKYFNQSGGLTDWMKAN